MDPKPILTSRTFWANVVGAVAFVVPFIFTNIQVIDADTQATITGGILVVVNLILRLVTTQPVTVP